jgi:hypothetical protein
MRWLCWIALLNSPSLKSQTAGDGNHKDRVVDEGSRVLKKYSSATSARWWISATIKTSM